MLQQSREKVDDEEQADLGESPHEKQKGPGSPTSQRNSWQSETRSEQEKHSANQETENWANFIQNINNLWSEMQKLSNFSEQE